MHNRRMKTVELCAAPVGKRFWLGHVEYEVVEHVPWGQPGRGPRCRRISTGEIETVDAISYMYGDPYVVMVEVDE